MKPDWKSSPPWANWLACNWKGYWFWFSYKPQPRLKTQIWKVLDIKGHDAVFAGFKYSEPSPYREWIKTLEKRPKDDIK
jgi:hypothetical protein